MCVLADAMCIIRHTPCTLSDRCKITLDYFVYTKIITLQKKRKITEYAVV